MLSKNVSKRILEKRIKMLDDILHVVLDTDTDEERELCERIMKLQRVYKAITGKYYKSRERFK